MERKLSKSLSLPMGVTVQVAMLEGCARESAVWYWFLSLDIRSRFRVIKHQYTQSLPDGRGAFVAETGSTCPAKIRAHKNICTKTSAQKHLHKNICTKTSAQKHLHKIARPNLSNVGVAASAAIPFGVLIAVHCLHNDTGHGICASPATSPMATTCLRLGRCVMVTRVRHEPAPILLRQSTGLYLYER